MPPRDDACATPSARNVGLEVSHAVLPLHGRAHRGVVAPLIVSPISGTRSASSQVRAHRPATQSRQLSQSVTFSLSGNSYGPNGELVVPIGCTKTFVETIRSDTTTYHYTSESGNEVTELAIINRNALKGDGCALGSGNPDAGYAYNGGQISANAQIGDTILWSDVFNADGTENGTVSLDYADGTDGIAVFRAGPINGSFPLLARLGGRSLDAVLADGG